MTFFGQKYEISKEKNCRGRKKTKNAEMESTNIYSQSSSTLRITVLVSLGEFVPRCGRITEK